MTDLWKGRQGGTEEEGEREAGEEKRRSCVPDQSLFSALTFSALTRKFGPLLLASGLGVAACKGGEPKKEELPTPPPTANILPLGAFGTPPEGGNDRYPRYPYELDYRLKRIAPTTTPTTMPVVPQIDPQKIDSNDPNCVAAKQEASILLSGMRLNGDDLLELIAMANKAREKSECLDPQIKAQIKAILGSIVSVAGDSEIKRVEAAIKLHCANPVLSRAIGEIMEETRRERENLNTSVKHAKTLPNCPD